MTTITIGKPVTAGEKELRTDYPKELGLIAGFTKQTGTKKGVKILKTTVTRNQKIGL